MDKLPQSLGAAIILLKIYQGVATILLKIYQGVATIKKKLIRNNEIMP